MFKWLGLVQKDMKLTDSASLFANTLASQAGVATAREGGKSLKMEDAYVEFLQHWHKMAIDAEVRRKATSQRATAQYIQHIR